MRKKIKVESPPPKDMDARGILYVRGVDKENIDFITEEAATMGYETVGDYMNTLIKQLRERVNRNAS